MYIGKIKTVISIIDMTGIYDQELLSYDRDVWPGTA